MTSWNDPVWQSLCAGEGCPLCETARGEFDEDPFGLTLLKTSSSLIRLARNQRARGYCIVVSTRHVVELFELGPGERQAFFDDVAAAGQAVHHLCRPVKVNYELLGNSVPHLHCHVVPRYPDDGAPGRPLPLFELPPVPAPDADFASLAAALRAELQRGGAGEGLELRFEPLGVNDLSMLQELCESCADYYHLMTGAPVARSEAHTLFTLRPETATIDDKFLIAVRQGKRLIGVLDLYRHYPRRDMAWLGLLLLHPDSRGHGHGAAMITWMLDWARSQGCTRLRVAIADDNLRALEVLKRHGFVPTGEKISRVSGARRLVLLPLERVL